MKVYVAQYHAALTAWGNRRPWIYADLAAAKESVERLIKMSFKGIHVVWKTYDDKLNNHITHTALMCSDPVLVKDSGYYALFPEGGSVTECEVQDAE